MVILFLQTYQSCRSWRKETAWKKRRFPTSTCDSTTSASKGKPASAKPSISREFPRTEKNRCTSSTATSARWTTWPTCPPSTFARAWRATPPSSEFGGKSSWGRRGSRCRRRCGRSRVGGRCRRRRTGGTSWAASTRASPPSASESTRTLRGFFFWNNDLWNQQPFFFVVGLDVSALFGDRVFSCLFSWSLTPPRLYFFNDL